MVLPADCRWLLSLTYVTIRRQQLWVPFLVVERIAESNYCRKDAT